MIFNNILKQAYSIYYDITMVGSRSSKKIQPIHHYIATSVKNKLNNDRYEVFCDGMGGEQNIVGRYTNKKIDISVSFDGKPIGGISVKMIMSNFGQNANNYFENLIGETVNLKLTNYKYSHVLILPQKLPYFKKNGLISKFETIKEHHLSKYKKLHEDSHYTNSPNNIYIKLIDTNTPKWVVENEELVETFDKDQLKQNLCENTIISDFDYNTSEEYSQDINDFLLAVGDYDEFIDKFIKGIKADI